MNGRRFWMPVLGLAAMLAARAGSADEAPFPPAGFPSDRYAALWTKSPFAIATPEAGAASADYSLVGLAQFDGVSYASLIEKQSGDHFVLASDKPVRNLTLLSIAHRADGATATINHNGETLTLRLENAPPSGGPNPNGVVLPPMNNPGANSPNAGGFVPYPGNPPPVRFHRRPIIVPPRPQ
jgi:hypothetical protein